MSREAIKRALQHRNVYGAGAAKRKHLSPEDAKKAVYAEGYRGTLHSGGSGKITHNPAQIAAIAESTKRAAIKRRRSRK